jgi:hypothetical protein
MSQGAEKEDSTIEGTIVALTYFSEDKAYRVLLTNLERVFGFYNLLMNLIKDKSTLPEARKSSSIMLQNFLVDDSFFGVADIFMRNGIL